MLRRHLVTVLIIVGILIPHSISLSMPIGSPLETVLVNSTVQEGTSSTTILQNGLQYYLLCEGTYQFSGLSTNIADAEWFYDGSPGDWYESWPLDHATNPPNQLDLRVDNVAYDWMGSASADPDPITDYSTFTSHTYSPSHKYWLPIMGTGSTINLAIWDDNTYGSYYDDNSGSLSVSIYTPEPTCIVLLTLGGLALLRRRQ